MSARKSSAAWKPIGVALLLAAVLASVAALVERASALAIRDEVRQSLMTVATLAAQAVSGEDLASIRGPEDRHTRAFERVLRTFRRVRYDVPSIVALYTLRPSDRPGTWEFVVDSEPDDVDRNDDGLISPDEEGAEPGQAYEVPAGADFDTALYQASADEQFTTDQWGSALSGYAPVQDEAGRAVAIVGVDLDRATFDARMDTMRLAVRGGTALLGLMLGATLLVYARLSRAYRRTVALQAQLVSAKVQLARFVPEVVRRQIERDPESPDLEKVERDVTVAFVDIAGYTRLSEVVPPERLNDLIEHYLSAFLEVIHGHGGDVTETAGDGFMAVFLEGGPEAHARAAAAAARDIVRRTAVLNRDRDPPLQVHIGLSSGTALVGATRLHAAGVDRWTFTATGSITNLAARVASGASPGEVLLTPESARRVGGAMPVRPLGPRRFKNVSKPIEVYALDVEAG